MEARLQVGHDFISLTIPAELKVPKLKVESIGRPVTLSYKGRLAIETGDAQTEIRTVGGAGSDQAACFDELAGPEIAALRQALAKQLDRVAASGTGRDAQQAVPVSVGDTDIGRMERAINGAAPGGENFWLDGTGPYSAETLLKLGEYRAARTR